MNTNEEAALRKQLAEEKVQNEALQKLVDYYKKYDETRTADRNTLQTRVERLVTEIKHVDEILARRRALDSCPTRIVKIDKLIGVAKAAQSLYDNRLGWSDGRNPYAPPEFWDRLGKAFGYAIKE